MKKFLFAFLIVGFWSSIAWTDYLCDVNSDGKVGLEEAIYALQVVAGINPGSEPPQDEKSTVINNPSGTVYEYNPTQIEQSTDLFILSVYEASSVHGSMAPANVTISNGGSKPLILVLSSYEPVNWNLNIAAGVNIQEIIINGYNAHNISGVDSALVTDKSGSGNYLAACGYSYPYNGQGCDTDLLFSGLTNYTGLSVSSFAGTYRANDFTVFTKE